MEWIDFQSPNRVLEEHGTKPKICVWDYTCVAGGFDEAAGSRHIVQETKLGIGGAQGGSEVVDVKVHDECKGAEDVN